MMQEVDCLPLAARFLHRILKVPANSQPDAPIREVELYYRDPVCLVKELISNPDFNSAGIMTYAPEEIYVESRANGEMEREYNEAHSGEWWNKIQVLCFLVSHFSSITDVL